MVWLAFADFGVAIPTIANQFDADLGPLQWANNAFSLATGALVIADVGQGAWEEVDYEPPARGGNNYGWRNREGAHDNVTSAPPAFLPLVDPIFEYSHSVGSSITGGSPGCPLAGIQSTPHSKGRTMRSLETDASRRSQA